MSSRIYSLQWNQPCGICRPAGIVPLPIRLAGRLFRRDLTDLPCRQDLADLLCRRDTADLPCHRDLADLPCRRDLADLLCHRDLADLLCRRIMAGPLCRQGMADLPWEDRIPVSGLTESSGFHF